MRVRAVLILTTMVLGVMLLDGVTLAVTKAPGSPITGDYVGQRNTSGSLSIECYTFYPDWTVELRHGGLPQVNDAGNYQGDATGGEIIWNSGRASSVVAQADGSLLIDGLRVTPIRTCLP